MADSCHVKGQHFCIQEVSTWKFVPQRSSSWGGELSGTFSLHLEFERNEGDTTPWKWHGNDTFVRWKLQSVE